MPVDLCPLCRRLTDVCCLLSCDLPAQIDEKDSRQGVSDAELESRGGRHRLQRANEASQLRSSATNRPTPPPRPVGPFNSIRKMASVRMCLRDSETIRATRYMRRRLDLGPERSDEDGRYLHRRIV